jgi:hypothetical protein
VQVLPGAHAMVLPLQLKEQAGTRVPASSGPFSQISLHVAEPVQVTVHPPAGQVTSQVLFPSQVTVVSFPTLRSQVLVPVQSKVLPLPAENVQVLPPAQLEVQLVPQVRSHCDWPSQVLEQPVPHTPPQVFLDEQP